MNKDGYIRQVNDIKAPEDLKMKIADIGKSAPKKKKGKWKAAVVAAACTVLVFTAVMPLFAGSLKAAQSDGSMNYAQGSVDEDYVQSPSHPESGQETGSLIQRKIIKNAVISIRTNNIDSFISSVNRDVNKTGGFVEELYDDTGKNRNVNMTLKIPADKLDEFLNSLSAKGTVESRNISNSDITDSYIETQSKINALEAEEKALLKLLESAENLSDVISLHDRLSQVRGELESSKTQKQAFDSQVSYSKVNVYVQGTQRTAKNGGSFASELREKFSDSLYNLGVFFRNFAVNFLGNLPYIAVAAVAAAVIIIIVVKIKKKNK